MTVLGYLPKLKRGLRLALGAHFLHDFSIKMFLKFQRHTFFSSPDIKKYVIELLFRKLMTP